MEDPKVLAAALDDASYQEAADFLSSSRSCLLCSEDVRS